jgi:hypothetical protein
VVRLAGFEPATPGSGVLGSIQLSYRRCLVENIYLSVNMKRYVREFFDKLCILTVLLSISLFLILAFKVVKIRSECTKAEARISSLIGEIGHLKNENKRLNIEFYKLVKPKLVDNETKDLKLLHENEVKYLR